MGVFHDPVADVRLAFPEGEPSDLRFETYGPPAEFPNTWGVFVILHRRNERVIVEGIGGDGSVIQRRAVAPPEDLAI